MGFAPPSALIVPAGTAAAVVASQIEHADPQLDARRWTRLAQLSPAARVEALHGMIAAGVFARVEDRVLVVRVVREGVRSLAAIVAIRSDGGVDAGCGTMRAGAPVDERIAIASAELEEALLAATRTRPIFHGTPPDGSTLSGFIPEDQDAILAAIASSLRTGLQTPGPAEGLPKSSPDGSQ
ncbi:MAG: hypothetical protein LW806_10775, partial [Planctomycetaceae bacterium]|nr:hypothetical protein [Planctomycetaceae bacterium]